MNATLDRITVRSEGRGAKPTREDFTLSTVVNEGTQTRRYKAATQSSQEHPWFPFQILLAYWICGPLAGGVVAGLNFARMGKREYLIPCFMLGAILFLAPLVGLVSAVHDWGFLKLVLLLSIMTHFTVGLAFMFEHQPHFKDWQKGQRYRGARGCDGPDKLEIYFVACSCCWIVAMVTAVLVLFVTFSQ